MLIRFLPRLLTLLIIAVALLIGLFLVAPHQLPVAMYKLCLISLGALAGYWIDRVMFPYARPDSFLIDDWRRTRVAEFGSPGAVDYPVMGDYQQVYAAAMIRRALIVMAVAIGVALGL
jgi:hypothetical protein